MEERRDLRVMYTTQLTKVHKTWKDGIAVCNRKRGSVTLYRWSETLGKTGPGLDEVFIAGDEFAAFVSEAEPELRMEKHLVSLEGVTENRGTQPHSNAPEQSAAASQQVPGGNASDTSTDGAASKKQKVFRGFKVPARVVNTERCLEPRTIDGFVVPPPAPRLTMADFHGATPTFAVNNGFGKLESLWDEEADNSIPPRTSQHHGGEARSGYRDGTAQDRDARRRVARQAPTPEFATAADHYSVSVTRDAQELQDDRWGAPSSAERRSRVSVGVFQEREPPSHVTQPRSRWSDPLPGSMYAITESVPVLSQQDAAPKARSFREELPIRDRATLDVDRRPDPFLRQADIAPYDNNSQMQEPRATTGRLSVDLGSAEREEPSRESYISHDPRQLSVDCGGPSAVYETAAPSVVQRSVEEAPKTRSCLEILSLFGGLTQGNEDISSPSKGRLSKEIPQSQAVLYDRTNFRRDDDDLFL